MKKNFTVNISGLIFHMDDDAYQKLDRYMDSIKKHYKNSDGAEEIITDIETRIADLLQEKLSDKKQVITIDDINDVVKVMGQPYEFESSETYENVETDFEPGKRPKRFYRDPDNKIIGGVSAGMGAYFRVDPLWFRVAFVALCFAGGSGLIAYFILWILIPEAQSTAEKLEMQGEKVNIENIEKKIKTEIKDIEEKLTDLTDKAKQAYKKKK